MIRALFSVGTSSTRTVRSRLRVRRVLANVRATAPGRDVVLLYHTPVERDTVDATRAFDVIADLGYGLAYRLRRTTPP